MSEKKPFYQALADANQRAADIVQTAVTAIKTERPYPVAGGDRMSTSREFTEEDLNTNAFDAAVEIDSDRWRHGRMVRLVWEADGSHWAAWFLRHHEEGDQTTYPVIAMKVHLVERIVKVWEAAP